MNARQTSIDVYHQIESEGLLKGFLWLTYKTLYHSGPLTQKECCGVINDPSIQDRSIMPRFAQLKAIGVIKEIGVKICSITGREVYLWDVTCDLPRKLNKTETQKVWWVLYPTGDIKEEAKVFRSQTEATKYKLQHGGNLKKGIQVGR